MGKTKRGKGLRSSWRWQTALAFLSAYTTRRAALALTRSPSSRATLVASFLDEEPERLIGDQAYDSDLLDAELAQRSVEMIALHRRRNRKKAK